MRLLAATLFALTPVSVAALSCTPHSVEAAYLEADGSEARFVVVKGQLEFDERKLPKADGGVNQTPPQTTRIKARLSGSVLSRKGFKTPFNKSVTLAVHCFGPWCASAQQGGEVLAFVEQSEAGDVITTNPCGGFLFHSPTPKMIRAVKGCFAGRSCKPLR
ncbi:hypothetical protein [Sulfitobacter donghicola]|uniref:Lipoprotein n=1 Tax=Sulfitobacter donghicola DSW-25 = KCTC 12864 = JCM 14565 TaxID=1300350 RepID=A0A073IKK3_9RHOB|nr:hypothetical protein [Sulfitobacter donghicola]KEJ90868.1 hypothetical protein DSW25_02920 [Sulfitobacter donghicola DSW-25 = KCTC 12864 = JCM 14565]KIN68147.1 hypothetical protein Z948_1874 [Sulfitobacter donghicola DSW-25 = KCTC 12864 = JCM 14565]